MVRKVYAQRKVLELYQKMECIKYPIRPQSLLPFLPRDCRILSYSRMAEVSKCSVEDVAVICKSSSGATHYDEENDRCLILYNDANNDGRALWTQCHEIGHICLGHLDVIDESAIADRGEGEPYDQFEREADYFAWNLIAPLPIMRELKISSIQETKGVFGLSSQAAALHYDRYIRWCNSHIKTAWENNMLREFRNKVSV